MTTFFDRWLPALVDETTHFILSSSSCDASSTSTVTVQFVPLADLVVRETGGMTQQRSPSSLFGGRPLYAALAWAGMSTLDVVNPAFPLPTTSSRNSCSRQMLLFSDLSLWSFHCYRTDHYVTYYAISVQSVVRLRLSF